MAKATKETLMEAVNLDQSEARRSWYPLVACKGALYLLYQYLYKKKYISFSIYHERRNKVSPWSDDLPEEVLGLIVLRLFGQDYCSFRAVCRTCRSKGNPFPLHMPLITQSLLPMTQSQWLVYLEEEDHILHVFHPLCKGSLIEIPGFSDSSICSSKDGWLLMWQYSRQVFFLNPFSKTIIELPDFPCQEWDYPEFKNGVWDMHLPALFFSAPPTSLNCIVFGISSSWSEGVVSICIIHHGEATWTIHKCLVNNRPFILSNASPVFHNGLVHCLSEYGNLGIFDLHKDSREECNWTVLARPLSPYFVLNIPDGNCFLVQCNGNLFSVFQGHMGKGISVFSLDSQRMIWNQVHDLENHMLFLTSQTSLLAKTAKVFDGMGGKIYFPIFPLSSDSSSNGGGSINSCSCVFYSLSTKIYHSFGTSLSNTDVSRMKIRRNCAWIEPNFVLPSNEDLKWGLKSSTN